MSFISWLFGRRPAGRDSKGGTREAGADPRASAELEAGASPVPPTAVPAPARSAQGDPPRAAGSREENRRILLDARTLEARGQRREAYALLHRRFVHLNAHEPDDSLPCLCRRCFQPELVETEVGGARYLREWTEARGRVLYFWLPWELRQQARKVRSGVAASLFGRLRGRR